MDADELRRNTDLGSLIRRWGYTATFVGIVDAPTRDDALTAVFRDMESAIPDVNIEEIPE